ncbi:MAG: hypothetical protein ACLFXM_05310 [Acidimicrobiia bacterium]
MNEKPRHRSGYTAEGTELVRSACLTVAATLGRYLDHIVFVGGVVPSLIIDAQRSPTDEDDEVHPGTNDLDLGLSLALLDEERYAEISARLRAEGFAPDTNTAGNATVQRWRLGDLKIDFLIPPVPGQDPRRRVQNLESDFGAIVTPGLELAFNERTEIEIDGTTLAGERARRTVPVCGPGAFVVLKTLAFADRIVQKDAYDLVYVVRGMPGGGGAIATRLKEHAVSHPEMIERAITFLDRDFASVDHVGPRRAAEFEHFEPGARVDAAADAHGLVDDLLRAYRA